MKEEEEDYFYSSYKSALWIKDSSRELYYYNPSKETKNESMIPKFNKYDAISMYPTSGAQRRQVHELFEKIGGSVSVRTALRDKKNDQCEYHLYIYTVRNAGAPQLRAASNTVGFTHNLKFHSFDWWMDKLNGKKYFDNTTESLIDTHLDKQLNF